MKQGNPSARATSSWLIVAALFVLCGVLGALQYRWIGEVSLAARDRLRDSLQGSLNRLSLDFNSEITAACRALLPAGTDPHSQAEESEFAARYDQWKKTGRHSQIFHRIAIAVPRNDDSVALRMFHLEKEAFANAEWPANWNSIRDRLEARLSPEPWQNRPAPGMRPPEEAFTFELPQFPPPRPGVSPFDRRQGIWLIFELNPQYIREVLLPELLQHHLGSDYQVEVLARTNPATVIYQSDPDQADRISKAPDASVGLFELQYDQIRRFVPAGPPPMRPGRRPEPEPEPRRFGRRGGPEMRERGPGLRIRLAGPDSGRWQMLVRHHAGSLEAVVSQARWRNLAVTAGVLLLLVATVAALVRFTRRAQKLAQLEMEFVAGVSHELRTPLTVIHTAAYNLRGKLANNPGQVERYGALIQQESGRLKDLVEQVLRFASAQAGRVVQNSEPLSVEAVIDETMESSKAVIQGSHCVVEKKVEPGLPLIVGDPMALKHALQNLVTNAAKYGAEGGNWIGVTASKTNDKEPLAVEIRVADRGPGIPEDEQDHIFDPFFRGRRAVQDQVHGTGLGLNLAKKIVEAHGGSIRVKSEPMKGTEFIVRIPAVPGGVAA